MKIFEALSNQNNVFFSIGRSLGYILESKIFIHLKSQNRIDSSDSGFYVSENKVSFLEETVGPPLLALSVLREIKKIEKK